VDFDIPSPENKGSHRWGLLRLDDQRTLRFNRALSKLRFSRFSQSLMQDNRLPKL